MGNKFRVRPCACLPACRGSDATLIPGSAPHGAGRTVGPAWFLGGGPGTRKGHHRAPFPGPTIQPGAPGRHADPEERRRTEDPLESGLQRRHPKGRLRLERHRIPGFEGIEQIEGQTDRQTQGRQQTAGHDDDEEDPIVRNRRDPQAQEESQQHRPSWAARNPKAPKRQRVLPKSALGQETRQLHGRRSPAGRTRPGRPPGRGGGAPGSKAPSSRLQSKREARACQSGVRAPRPAAGGPASVLAV